MTRCKKRMLMYRFLSYTSSFTFHPSFPLSLSHEICGCRFHHKLPFFGVLFPILHHCAPLPRSQDDSAFPWKTQPLEKSEAFPWAIQTFWDCFTEVLTEAIVPALETAQNPKDFPENPVTSGVFNVFANSFWKVSRLPKTQQKNVLKVWTKSFPQKEPSFRFFHGGEADSWHPYRRCRAEVWCFGAICLEKHGNFTNKSSPSSCLINIFPI